MSTAESVSHSCSGALRADAGDWVRLARLNWPDRKLRRALQHYQSPTALFMTASEEVASRLELSERNRVSLDDVRRSDVTSDLEAMTALSVEIVGWGDDDYPERLSAIADPPPVLFGRGGWRSAGEASIAMVGTRRASHYGLTMAQRLARDLARRGVVIVSGLAYGIDSAAHEAALEAGGRTVAVFGAGIDVIYPADHRSLAERILNQGGVLSPFAPGARPQPWRFPARNRIISGLTLATIVVEAPANSGALITADCAAEQGRLVFAVPGSALDNRNDGGHELLREGAILARSADDVIAHLELDVGHEPAVAPPAPPDDRAAALSPQEHKVLSLLTFEEQHVDRIARASQLPASEVNASLMLLEIKGLARRLPGSMFVRTEP